MSKKIFLILLLLIFAAGCSISVSNNDNTYTQPDEQINPSDDSENMESGEMPLADPQCYGEETHLIGESIADLYPDITNYDQVMSWFCSGYEFEDIITGLETQMDTGVQTEDLLAMFRNGQNWDEIWVELGVIKD